MNKKRIHNINNTGFKVPKDYFNNLEDVIMNDIHLKESIKGSGFNTPKNYFETFDDKLFDTLETKPETKVRKLSPWKPLAYVSGIAASFLILFGLYHYNSNNLSFETLETASIANYLSEENYSSNELASFFSEEDLTVEGFIDEPIGETILEEYLIEHTMIEDLMAE